MNEKRRAGILAPSNQYTAIRSTVWNRSLESGPDFPVGVELVTPAVTSPGAAVFTCAGGSAHLERAGVSLAARQDDEEPAF